MFFLQVRGSSLLSFLGEVISTYYTLPFQYYLVIIEITETSHVEIR